MPFGPATMPQGATKNKPRIRVVVDTNAWVSRSLNPQSLVARRLGRLLRNRRVDLLFSQTLQAEILEVIQRPKFKKYITARMQNGSPMGSYHLEARLDYPVKQVGPFKLQLGQGVAGH